MTEPVLVWVVDDDEAIRFVLTRALGRAGYVTESFGSVTAVTDALDPLPSIGHHYGYTLTGC